MTPPQQHPEQLFNLFVPGPVVAKGRPRATGTGRSYTPAGTRHYEARMADLAYTCMAGHKPFTGPVAIRLVFYLVPPKGWPQWRRRSALDGLVAPTVKPDFDNLAKTIDALNTIVWADDAQVVTALIEKKYAEQPGMQITVRKLRLLRHDAKRDELHTGGFHE